jgi:hypothetical protein
VVDGPHLHPVFFDCNVAAGTPFDSGSGHKQFPTDAFYILG